MSRSELVIDYCCGAGGASLGMHSLGLDPIGFDWWDHACRTHQAAGFRTVRCDLTAFAWRPASVRLMWASPPCQPFSAAGDHDGHDDDRDLIPAWLASLEVLKPEIAVMENVRGLTYEKHLPYLARVLRRVHTLGYRFDWRVLDCADYGVPQNRERFILIARRDGGPLAWPAITHTEQPGMFTAQWVTMAEALGWDGAVNTGRDWKPGGDRASAQTRDMDSPAPAVSTETLSQWQLRTDQSSEHADGRYPIARALDEPANTVDAAALSKWSWQLQPGSDKNRPRRADLEPAPTIAFGKDAARWCWNRPATTVAGDPRIFQPGGHHQPGEQSWNPVRVEAWEAAVLQSFPADYPFTGGRTAQAQQIGNAVPPLLARVVVAALLG